MNHKLRVGGMLVDEPLKGVMPGHVSISAQAFRGAAVDGYTVPVMRSMREVVEDVCGEAIVYAKAADSRLRLFADAEIGFKHADELAHFKAMVERGSVGLGFIASRTIDHAGIGGGPREVVRITSIHPCVADSRCPPVSVLGAEGP